MNLLLAIVLTLMAEFFLAFAAIFLAGLVTDLIRKRG